MAINPLGETSAPGAASPLQPADVLRAYSERSRLIDVALGRPASQSSTSEWSTPDDAAGAVNGTFPSDYGFHTGFEFQPWWQVDLGWTYSVELIVVHNRRLGSQERARTIEILISSDGDRWVSVHRNSLVFESGLEGLPLILALRGSVSCRYVRVQLDGMNYLHLSQVQVFAAGPERKVAELLATLAADAARRSASDLVRLGILGTSNSVMVRGYTAFLRSDPAVALVCNLSLGASHPTIVPYRWSDEEVARCDVLVLDLNVNEQFGLESRAYQLGFTERALRDSLAKCADLGVIPLISIMPEGMSYAPGNPFAFQCRTNWLGLCRQYGVPFFDGYQMVEDLAAATGHPASSFLKDPLHLDPRLLEFFATCLRFSATILLPSLDAQLTPAQVSRGSYIPAATARSEAEQQAMRSTSILSETVLLLRPGQPIVLPVPPGVQVVGLVVNIRGSNAALRLSGEDVVTKNLNTPFFDGGTSIWMLSWALLCPVRADANGIKLECVLCENLDAMECNDHGNAPHKATTAEAVVELAGLVLMARPAPATLPAYQGEIDLWRSILGVLRLDRDGTTVSVEP